MNLSVKDVDALVLKIKGQTITHRVKKLPFQDDPDLHRTLSTLGGYRGSRRFMHAGHVSPKVAG